MSLPQPCLPPAGTRPEEKTRSLSLTLRKSQFKMDQRPRDWSRKAATPGRRPRVGTPACGTGQGGSAGPLSSGRSARVHQRMASSHRSAQRGDNQECGGRTHRMGRALPAALRQRTAIQTTQRAQRTLHQNPQRTQLMNGRTNRQTLPKRGNKTANKSVGSVQGRGVAPWRGAPYPV